MNINLEKDNLLICSYKLHILIKEKSPHCLIKKYISQVHSILDYFQNTQLQIKPIRFYEFYINYITKWIYSLIITSKHLKSSKYIYLASQFMITLINNVDYVNINELHKLDIFITLSTLLINLKHFKQTPSIKLYIKLLKSYLNLYYQIDNSKILNTNDPYELGFLLESCLKIRLIIKYNIIDSKLLYKLYDRLLKQSRISLNKIQFKQYSINSDAYKWYSLCIGLEAIKILDNYYINKKFNDIYNKNVKVILKYYSMKRNIISNFKNYSYNKGNCNAHKDINMIMLENTDYPILTI